MEAIKMLEKKIRGHCTACGASDIDVLSFTSECITAYDMPFFYNICKNCIDNKFREEKQPKNAMET